LWGRDLLVAPVVEKNAKSRRVYLPAGTWFDWWTGKKIDGKRWIERSVDLTTIPLYARAGSIIPLDPVRQFTSQPVAEPTTLRIYPGSDGTSTLYNDDGQTLSYGIDSDPQNVWIRFHWNDNADQLTLEQDNRMKKWPGGIRPFAVEVAGSKAAPTLVDFRGERVMVAPVRQ
jgi:alpha-glucosidase/alpha-D-xyloside xylohydrolase